MKDVKSYRHLSSPQKLHVKYLKIRLKEKPTKELENQGIA